MAAAVVNIFRKSVFLLFLADILVKCYANDILGCGGFVESHASLDFSKIEIGLYTKGGSLKERTECAPTNGYYFLPLYEKGEYVLKVHPPAGWSFEPSQVDLVVDGVTDQCSTGQDVNFTFNGFGITGRVITAGQKLGPSGISVQLIDDSGTKRDTVTTVGGDFHFTPVIPGKYTVKASHPRWKLEPGQAVVQVKEGNTALPVGVLAVKGYDVQGSVVSYGNPISGLYVLLYSKEESPKFRVEGCKTALLQGVPDAPICHAITDAAGEFSFGLVPAGEYRLVVLSKPPGQATVSYIVKPERVAFSVAHDSLFIKNAFEVTGFTLVGTVLSHASGPGVPGARVLMDGRPVGVTDATGKFTLPALQPGGYSMGFQHEQCEFDDVKLSITPSGPASAPVARAARWRVCGAVAPTRARDVTITADGGDHVTIAVGPANDGKWCTFLKPGVYSAKVEVSEQEQLDGLQFYPLTQKISVGHAPVDGIVFSQLKATVSGLVVCAPPAACEALPVTLRPLSLDGGYVGQPQTTVANNGKYTFVDVLPGSVEVSVPVARLCWAEARHNVALAHATASVPAFEQRGYVLRMQSTHDIQVEYVGTSSKGVLDVPKGASQQCVESAERYALTPRGCHRFQPPQAHADTSADMLTTVSFVAMSHAVVVRVLSPDPARDVVLAVSADGAPSKDVGPLPPLALPQGGYAFEHTLYLTEGEIAVVSASSSSLLFHPREPQQVLGLAECQPEALTLRAVRGLTLAGRIVPPVEGVTVTITSDADDLKLSHTTDSTGSYRFGPLDASRRYSVAAEKESYVFGAADARGDIAAHKLAEITVELVDDADGTPLQGALVSVSGGSYRRNVASGADGRLVFGALSPAQYYVKPNMKEYRFRPQHHIVHVAEGRTHALALRGVRVAWSCVGRVVSLGGAGWAGAALAAEPAHAPHCATEEASADGAGAFRIRGLLPGCEYSLQLKPAPDAAQAALTLAKAPPRIEIKNNKDIVDVLLIAVQPQQVTDVAVLVHTPNVDHYKTLRLSLAPDASPHGTLYATKMDPAGYSNNINPGLMYVLPRLPADNKTYVLQLESTLSKSTHTYEDEVHYFTSDGRFKHFTIEFVPKVKASEQELRQTSLLVVPLLGLIVLAYLQRDLLLDRALSLAESLKRAPVARTRAPVDRTRADVLDKASIEHIVTAVNAAGKRGAKKKVPLA